MRERNALGKNNLSAILAMPTIILNIAIRRPVIRGDNHVPNVVPTVKYAFEIRLNAEILIEVNSDSFNYKK